MASFGFEKIKGYLCACCPVKYARFIYVCKSSTYLIGNWCHLYSEVTATNGLTKESYVHP